MLKKLLIAVLSFNFCFSGLAFAQQRNPGDSTSGRYSNRYHPEEELTPEEVELYMSSIDKKEKGLPTIVKVGGGAVAVLGTAYAVRKIIKNPELGRYYVASQDPRAYSTLMKYAEKKAATPAAKKAISEAAKREAAAMETWNASMRHSGKIKQISRGNYWKFIRSSMAGDWSKANQALNNMKRAQNLLRKPVTSKTGRVFKNIKRAGKLGLVIGLVAYVAFGDNNSEETTISNNRVKLERAIMDQKRKDVDSLALFIYNLPEDQREVAYGILSEDSATYAIVQQQVEEAFSAENIKATEDYLNEIDASQKRGDIVIDEDSLMEWGGFDW